MIHAYIYPYNIMGVGVSKLIMLIENSNKSVSRKLYTSREERKARERNKLPGRKSVFDTIGTPNKLFNYHVI